MNHGDMHKSNFKQFKENVRNIGGVFTSEHVYFSQLTNSYIAAYLPHYPNDSKHDISITQVWNGLDSYIEASLIPGSTPKRLDDFDALRHYISDGGYESDLLYKVHDDATNELENETDLE